jgi:hypothetical protein
MVWMLWDGDARFKMARETVKKDWAKGSRLGPLTSLRACLRYGGADSSRGLMQLGILGFGGDEDGNVGVGVFPQSEEILIGGAGLRDVALHNVGSSDLKMR